MADAWVCITIFSKKPLWKTLFNLRLFLNARLSPKHLT